MATSGFTAFTANRFSRVKGQTTSANDASSRKSLPMSVRVGRNGTPMAAALRPSAMEKLEWFSTASGAGSRRSTARR